jgi:hypothetical protein
VKITMESTDIFTEWHGVPCRVWRGITEGGVKCDVMVPTMRVREDHDRAEFERDLRSLPDPITVIPLRMLI